MSRVTLRGFRASRFMQAVALTSSFAALAAIIASCGSVAVPPQGIVDDSITLVAATPANAFACWDVTITPAPVSVDNLNDNVEWATQPTIVDVAEVPGTPPGRNYKMYLAFPPGGKAALKAKNLFNTPLTVTINARSQVPAIPAPNLLHAGLRSRSGVETILPVPPEITLLTHPSLGSVLRLRNVGTLPLRVKTLELALTETTVSFADVSYSSPAMSTLPWVVAVSSDLDLSPGQSTEVDIPDLGAQDESNLFLRSRYSGTSMNDPTDEVVVAFQPFIATVPAMSVAGVAVAAIVLLGMAGAAATAVRLRRT